LPQGGTNVCVIMLPLRRTLAEETSGDGSTISDTGSGHLLRAPRARAGHCHPATVPAAPLTARIRGTGAG